ncbi:hypothetical protein N7532_000019 [Penicillium argentinense]|uniref:Sulfatase N-terminal domain-containing protein n=1 Tax=Penicillium argentinense TaxID=1131581 RepID=A0A9W9KM84_9EURO|nr:uncharacterized protein N7532_000019 [Penicillium argentinense]KAJ5111974.1 hypothetical protein N7532_000019 [Penicillium argentinense]
MPDQLRYDSLGCTGNKHVKTPNIDAFAKQGTLFSNCWVQASVCTQSRCSIFTGNYPHVSGHRSIDNLIKPWELNVFRSMKEEAGYHIACLAPRGDTFAPTVTELSMDEYGFLETLEFMPKFNKPPTEEDKNNIWNRFFYKGWRNAQEAVDYDEAVVRLAIKWMERPPTGKPWVLFMPLIFPHCPFMVEEPYFSMYGRDDMPAPAPKEKKTGYEPRYMQAIREQYGTARATPEMWREIMATYYGMITRLDDQFGRVIQKAKDIGVWDSTISMFFTDHGEYLGDYGLIEKWPAGLSESLTREPLIIGGGGLPEGVVYDEMSEMVDLLPTVFEFTGIGEHFPHCGKSFADALLKGGKEVVPHRKYAFTEGGFLTSEEPLLEQGPYPYDIKGALQHNNTELVGKAVSCRSKKWTYIYRLYEPPELYSRENDPEELQNLAEVPEYAVLRREMEAAVLKFLMESSDFLPWQRDPRFPETTMKSPLEQWNERTPVSNGQTA